MIALVWLAIAFQMNPNLYQLTLSIPYESTDQTILNLMRNIPGVEEAIFDSHEKIIYLRVNKILYKMGSAEQIIADRSGKTIVDNCG